MDDVIETTNVITVGKPGMQEFFRVHPEYEAAFWVLELKGMPTEYYLVDIKAVPELASEASIRCLVPIITKSGTVSIWPLRVPSNDKPFDLWGKSALAARKTAKTSWIRLIAGVGFYNTLVAKGNVPDPEWPDMDLDTMIEMAFEGRIIDTSDHPVVLNLLGAA